MRGVPLASSNASSPSTRRRPAPSGTLSCRSIDSSEGLLGEIGEVLDAVLAGNEEDHPGRFVRAHRDRAVGLVGGRRRLSIETSVLRIS